MLSAEPTLEVVGEAGSGAQALALAAELEPDVLLVDITMKLMNGFALTREVVQRQPQVRIVMLSVHDSQGYMQEAQNAGAHGYVKKDAPAERILDAIGVVMAGGTYFPDLKPPVPDPLTPTEKKVLILVAREFHDKDIAEELDISVKTVQCHRLSVRKKTEIDTPAGFYKYALERGWLEP